jgi:hypothetical protein
MFLYNCSSLVTTLDLFNQKSSFKDNKLTLHNINKNHFMISFVIPYLEFMHNDNLITFPPQKIELSIDTTSLKYGFSIGYKSDSDSLPYMSTPLFVSFSTGINALKFNGADRFIQFKPLRKIFNALIDGLTANTFFN